MEDKLLKLLYEDDVITEAQYQQVVENSENASLHCETILQQLGILSEDNWVRFLCQKFRMPMINWNEFRVNQEVLQLLPAALARKYTVFPYAFERGKRGGKITLAVADPTDVSAVDDIAFRTGCVVKTGISSFRAIEHALQQFYGSQEAAPPQPSGREGRPKTAAIPLEKVPLTKVEAFDALLPNLFQSGEVAEGEPDILKTLDQDPPSKALLDLLETALTRGASEIHLEPSPQDYRIRLALGGMLQPAGTISEQIGRGIAVRLKKLLQRTDSAAAKKETPPWCGSLHTSLIRGEQLTAGISFFPTIYGEKMLLKLALASALRPFDKLGMSEPNAKLLGRILSKTEGMVVLLAPPGHGMTTTYYSLLRQFDPSTMRIFSFEMPVALMLSGITQLAPSPTGGYCEWASFLGYSAPDVIGFGTIQHELLSRLAYEFAASTQVIAACTAYHALNGLETVTAFLSASLHRLPAQIAPVFYELLNGMVSQRLIRVLCPHCKERVSLAEYPQDLVQWAADILDGYDQPLYRSKGCQKCQNTGYIGQTGVFEVIRIDKQVKQVLLRQPISASQWQHLLTEMAVVTLKQQGVQKVRDGLTSLEELRRVLSE